MSNKIALVTGGNRGIGFETVRQLAQQGVHVILASRRRAEGVEAALKLQQQGLSVEALELEVGNSASITAAAEAVKQRHGRLDILVNNAGVLGEAVAQPSAQSLATWREVFDINVFGLVEVTLAFLPLIRLSDAGRIVNVSSLLGSNAEHQREDSGIYHFKNVPAYNVSKSAVNAWTVQLAYELRETNVKVNAIHPGYVKTEMNKGEGELEIADGAKSSVQMALLDASGATGSYTYLGQTIPW